MVRDGALRRLRPQLIDIAHLEFLQQFLREHLWLLRRVSRRPLLKLIHARSIVDATILCSEYLWLRNYRRFAVTLQIDDGFLSGDHSTLLPNRNRRLNFDHL